MPVNAAGKPCGRGSAGVKVAGRKFGLYRPRDLTLGPLPDDVIEALFRQSIIPYRKGEPYIEGVRRLVRLVEAELQGRLQTF